MDVREDKYLFYPCEILSTIIIIPVAFRFHLIITLLLSYYHLTITLLSIIYYY